MNTARLNQGTPLLLNAVSKHYAENIVLNQLDLHIPAGQFVAVVGRSGGGKSTLLRLLAGLETPTAGDVLAGTTPLAEIQDDTRMMFQDARLLPWKSVIDNVGLGLKGQWRDAARRALAAVGLENRAGEWPAALSGGQKQRVAIARALASNPKVLLCDEATSALDPATTRSILELLKDINRRLGLTILLITHEMDVVKRICDCVAVISNGELIEQDTVSEVFSHPKTPLAQKFIQSTLHLDIPEDYQERLQAEPFTDCVPMLRLEFTGQSVDAPLLSETARRFNVNNNIISAQMDYAGGVKFGIMLTEMHGTQQDTQAAIAWLQEHHVKVEVLGYV